MADVISFGSDKPRGPRRRWIAAVGAALLAAVVVAVALDQGGHHSTPGAGSTPTAGTSRPPDTATTATGASGGDGGGRPCVPLTEGISPPPAEAPAAVALGDASGSALDTGSALDRCDRAAADGPWSAVVRRDGGRLGRGEAVVTFPVATPSGAREVVEPGLMVVRIGNGWVRIRGDLDPGELARIANRVTTVDGHPFVRPPAGFAVVATTPYRAPSRRELRYGSDEVGEQAALGNGLTYAGIAAAGGFLDALHAGGVPDAVTVNGMPAVISTVYGG
ncbi:MAG TPA: hypothetical protein VKB69_08740, partial [Micromonosporaceae bacterium]|nr:hypothetical protein [Micromonosporaceae bacterium]